MERWSGISCFATKPSREERWPEECPCDMAAKKEPPWLPLSLCADWLKEGRVMV